MSFSVTALFRACAKSHEPAVLPPPGSSPGSSLSCSCLVPIVVHGFRGPALSLSRTQAHDIHAENPFDDLPRAWVVSVSKRAFSSAAACCLEHAEPLPPEILELGVAVRVDARSFERTRAAAVARDHVCAPAHAETLALHKPAKRLPQEAAPGQRLPLLPLPLYGLGDRPLAQMQHGKASRVSTARLPNARARAWRNKLVNQDAAQCMPCGAPGVLSPACHSFPGPAPSIAARSQLLRASAWMCTAPSKPSRAPTQSSREMSGKRVLRRAGHAPPPRLFRGNTHLYVQNAVRALG